MDTKFWDENKQHLFHGTIIDNKDSILEFGLIPDIGPFVSDAYGEDFGEVSDEQLEDLLGAYTFAADLDGLGRSLNAIIAQIAYKEGKSFHDVTEQEIRENGILFIIEFGKSDEFMERRPDEDDYYGEYSYTVEPGDYYSETEVGVDSYLEGQELVDFITRYRIWYDDIPEG